MSHHAPFYAAAPLGQAPSQPLPAAALVEQRSSSAVVATASTMSTVWRVAGTVAGAALAYHGYKRTGSIGWALAWAVLGGFVWPVGLGIAYAQGFGKPAVRRNRRRSR